MNEWKKCFNVKNELDFFYWINVIGLRMGS